MRDFNVFIGQEKQSIQNNIARLNRGLQWYQDGNALASGHLKLLDVQKRHLAMLDTLFEGDTDPIFALVTCEETLKLAEQKHQQLIDRGQTNNELWWETLDVIQFMSSLIDRIDDWQHDR